MFQALISHPLPRFSPIVFNNNVPKIINDAPSTIKPKTTSVIKAAIIMAIKPRITNVSANFINLLTSFFILKTPIVCKDDTV